MGKTRASKSKPTSWTEHKKHYIPPRGECGLFAGGWRECTLFYGGPSFQKGWWNKEHNTPQLRFESERPKPSIRKAPLTYIGCGWRRQAFHEQAFDTTTSVIRHQTAALRHKGRKLSRATQETDKGPLHPQQRPLAVFPEPEHP